ncbi:MAG: hypothetical protein IJ748_04535 [Bacteroidales bacterium]|nr:hypothetical protein [Bacteroidales bacterium]
MTKINSLLKYSAKTFFCLEILLFLYILLASYNFTADAYAYANSSVQGKNLFYPHHLLYSAYGYLLMKVFGSLVSDPLILFELSNIFFGILSLFVSGYILWKANCSTGFINSGIIFLGSCFAFIRFAMDNECYMMPLFFTLCALACMQSFFLENKLWKVVLATLFLSLGCLFHQLVIVTWLCVFIILVLMKNKKYFLSFLSLSLSVPLVYSSVYFFSLEGTDLAGFFHFITNDYSEGYAQGPNLKTILLLSPISFFRTFFQVHGYMLNILDYQAEHITIWKSVLYLFVFSCFVFILLTGFYEIKRVRKKEYIADKEKKFIHLLWAVGVANLLFACISNGNSEFMLILPFIIIFLLHYYFKNLYCITCFGIVMFIWNCVFVMVPHHDETFSSDAETVDFIRHNIANYVLSDKPKIENMYVYRYKEEPQNVFYSARLTKEVLDSLLNDKKIVITDCLSTENLSRQKLTGGNKLRSLLKEGTMVTEIRTFYSLSQGKTSLTIMDCSDGAEDCSLTEEDKLDGEEER